MPSKTGGHRATPPEKKKGGSVSQKATVSVTRQSAAQAAKQKVRQTAAAKNRAYAEKELPKTNRQPTSAEEYARRAAVNKAKREAKSFVAGKVAGGAAKKLAGPAVLVGQTLGGPSASPKQTQRQVSSFEKKNPGVKIVQTKSGYKTMEKAPKRMVKIVKGKK